jgi:hypothetical protein
MNEISQLKSLADQIIPRQQDTLRHLEQLEHCVSWLELCCQDFVLNDSNRLKIRELSCQIENFCDDIFNDLSDCLNQHDPAHGLDTSGLAEIVEAYR